jgi:hypothetical protein
LSIRLNLSHKDIRKGEGRSQRISRGAAKNIAYETYILADEGNFLNKILQFGISNIYHIAFPSKVLTFFSPNLVLAGA